MTVSLFVGLGNPGTSYQRTRHNIGWLVLEALAQECGLSWRDEPRFFSRVARGVVDGVSVHLLCPTTYMNDSGKAVRAYLDYYKLSPSDLLVVMDDTDLPFGTFRIREQGSAGGHNGLRDIQRAVGTQTVPRLRFGIGHPVRRQEKKSFVLDRFSKDEEEALPGRIAAALPILHSLLDTPIERVMNKTNTIVQEKNHGTSTPPDEPV